MIAFDLLQRHIQTLAQEPSSRWTICSGRMYGTLVLALPTP